MIKTIKEQYKTLLLVAALVLIMVLDVFIAPTHVTASSSTSKDRYENPTEVVINPFAESEKIAEEQQQAIQEEGTKSENQTVDGQKTGANGLYMANKVKGVAVDPNKDNGNGAGLFVETLNTDQQKSSAAMDSINAAASSYGGILIHLDGSVSDIPAEVGPVVDVYFKKTDANGNLVDGTAKDVDDIKIGIPDSFKEDGYTYGAICVLPGGKVIRSYSYGEEQQNYVSVNLVHDTYNDPIDYECSVGDSCPCICTCQSCACTGQRKT